MVADYPLKAGEILEIHVTVALDVKNLGLRGFGPRRKVCGLRDPG